MKYLIKPEELKQIKRIINNNEVGEVLLRINVENNIDIDEFFKIVDNTIQEEYVKFGIPKETIHELSDEFYITEFYDYTLKGNRLIKDSQGLYNLDSEKYEDFEFVEFLILTGAEFKEQINLLINEFKI